RSWQPLHEQPIDVITRQSIVNVVDDVELASDRVSADRARMALSGLFGWAIDRGYLDANPTLNVRARQGERACSNRGRTRRGVERLSTGRSWADRAAPHPDRTAAIRDRRPAAVGDQF